MAWWVGKVMDYLGDGRVGAAARPVMPQWLRVHLWARIGVRTLSWVPSAEAEQGVLCLRGARARDRTRSHTELAKEAHSSCMHLLDEPPVSVLMD